MSLVPEAIAYSVHQTQIPAQKVMKTCALLFEEDCTIPFISRYRKEATGGLDEVQIRDIQSFYEEYLEIEKRRAFILKTLKEQEKLTKELEGLILKAQTLNQLEDIYAPYKSKRKTKGMLAKEKGLEPLAMWILESNQSIESIQSEIESKYRNDQVKNIEEALEGATHILSEMFSQSIEVKEEIRNLYWSTGIIKSEKRKDAESVKDFNKYKDFFEFTESIKNIKEARNSHRFLALRRGMSQKVLRVTTSIDNEVGYQVIQKIFFPDSIELGNRDFLKKVAKKSFDISISTSMDLEMKTETKKYADEAAINVFKVNLKNLLLQPYLGSKAVLGIDPGIRTGCKLVIIDDTGKFVGDHVIYPFAPKFDTAGSKVILEKMIDMFKISYIAIGNGTNGRETLEFVQDNLKCVQDDKVKAVMVNESGASIYSASDIAREEFPDKDVTVRGSISIARRFQDPLAELVKIDPKSIGVGQYQHDVSQTKLKKSLSGVVEDCVNYVGVDLNTASAPLLSYISGVGPALAKNIVSFREKNQGFKNRKELLKVTRFSEKIFEQAAGFLRIYSGSHPLDGTFIHPERYEAIESWCKKKNIEVEKLIENRDLIISMQSDNELKNQMGELTLNDIINALKSPKQDPRSEFKPIEFRKDVRKIEDLKVGQWYTGIVNNITNFGAFVDLGVKESGLLHVSQISDEFVSNPMDKLKVGEEVKVRVTELDLERKRIGLSAKSEDGVKSHSSGNATSKASSKRKPRKQEEFKNNAFAGLAGFKLK